MSVQRVPLVWDDLRYVLALARTQTLSAAAEALAVTHTTVGRRLRRLETDLGTRLFDRTPDGLVPTAAGSDLVETAERMEAAVHGLEGRLVGRDARLKGPLRVATMDMLFKRHRAVFTSFAEAHPEVTLTVLVSDEEVSLTRREADVVLRMTSSPPDYLVGRRVGRERFAVYGAVELVARVGAEAPWSAFPWIHWDERSAMARWLDGWLAAHAPGARVALRVDMATTMLAEVIASGIGVHFMAVPDGDADARLRRIGPIIEDVSRDLWLLTMPDLRASARVRAFMDHAAARITAADG